MNTKTYAWAALSLSLIVPNTLVSGEYSSGKEVYGSKEVYDSEGVTMFEETPYTIDLYGGASTVYNSNTTQLSDGTSAWVAIFDFGFDFESANQGGRGSDYGFGYDGAAYWWESSTAAAGRDPFEHRLDGYVQVNGGKTRFRIGSDFYRNNGNAMDFVNVNREARSAQSNDWGLNASLVRDLSRGSFEAGAGYNLRDFDAGTGLNDQNSYMMDIALFHRFAGAPKTSYGLGFRFGSDDSSQNVDQDFHTTRSVGATKPLRRPRPFQPSVWKIVPQRLVMSKTLFLMPVSNGKSLPRLTLTFLSHATSGHPIPG